MGDVAHCITGVFSQSHARPTSRGTLAERTVDSDARWLLLIAGYQFLRQPPPSFRPSSSAANEPDNQQEQQGANRGVDDRRNDADAEMDAELRHQPPADEGSDDSDDKVTYDPKSGATYDLASQPSRNEADHQDDQQTLDPTYACSHGSRFSVRFYEPPLGRLQLDVPSRTAWRSGGARAGVQTFGAD
jgi:hypothetical protein